MKVTEYKELIKNWDIHSRLTKKIINYINLAITNRTVVDKNSLSICDFEIESFKKAKFREFSKEIGKVTGITKKTQIKLFNEAFRCTCLKETGWVYVSRQYRAKFCIELVDKVDTQAFVYDLVNFCDSNNINIVYADLITRAINCNGVNYAWLLEPEKLVGEIVVTCITESEFKEAVKCLDYFEDFNQWVYSLKVDVNNCYSI